MLRTVIRESREVLILYSERQVGDHTPTDPSDTVWFLLLLPIREVSVVSDRIQVDVVCGSDGFVFERSTYA